MKITDIAVRATLYVRCRVVIIVAVGLAAFAATTILGPAEAEARDQIVNVACTSAYPGLKSWEIVVEVKAGMPNLDRKWLGLSINAGGRWLDLDPYYLVSSQEYGTLNQSRAAGIVRRATWVIRFESRAQPQALGRPQSTRGRQVPPGLRNASGYPRLSPLSTSLHSATPYKDSYPYTVALWEDRFGNPPKNLARVRSGGCP